MKLRSKGLGKRELVMDLRECDIKYENGEVVLKGTVKSPVTWEFTIKVGQDDMLGMLKVASRPSMWRLGFRWFFHIHPKVISPEVVVEEENIANKPRSNLAQRLALQNREEASVGGIDG